MTDKPLEITFRKGDMNFTLTEDGISVTSPERDNFVSYEDMKHAKPANAGI